MRERADSAGQVHVGGAKISNHLRTIAPDGDVRSDLSRAGIVSHPLDERADTVLEHLRTVRICIDRNPGLERFDRPRGKEARPEQRRLGARGDRRGGQVAADARERGIIEHGPAGLGDVAGAQGRDVQVGAQPRQIRAAEWGLRGDRERGAVRGHAECDLVGGERGVDHAAQLGWPPRPQCVDDRADAWAGEHAPLCGNDQSHGARDRGEHAIALRVAVPMTTATRRAQCEYHHPP